ncbi:MAG: type transport system permease protein [Solirubrobacteraceae bacterium]|nr:type transport system permease protein [Solirubrobacteraceae bacterium]
MTVLARFALREALRKRVFTVVAWLTAAFLALYALGVWQAFKISDDLGGGFADVDPDTVVGATMFGLALFGTLFLGVVLAVFLTLGTIRGDAERGLLQPLLVRPVTRRDVLLSRLFAAGGVSALYVLGVYLAAMVITGVAGGWWPGNAVLPALELMLAVVVVTAISLAGSVVLAATANGIAVFMAFGAGLTAGLLGQIGDALNSGTLSDVADVSSYLLPFEALYQAALGELTAGETGFNRFVLQLGPLGGERDAGPALWLWALVYLAAVTAAALRAFRRSDL